MCLARQVASFAWVVANLAWVVASIAWFLDNWSAKPVLSDPGLGLLFAIVAGMSALQKNGQLE